jgi:PadR family transcriptional regulator PadR
MPKVSRKPDGFVPLERAVLAAALELTVRGELEFHGYALGQLLEDGYGAYRRTGFGSLYRALSRLVDDGCLTSHWSVVAGEDGAERPRRLYQLTALGKEAAHSAQGTLAATSLTPRLRLS